MDVDDAKTNRMVAAEKTTKAHEPSEQHNKAFVIKRSKGCSSIDIGHCVHVTLDRVAGVIFKNQIVGAAEIIAVIVHFNIAGIDPYDGSDRDKGSQHERIHSVCVRTIEKQKEKRRKKAYDGYGDTPVENSDS